MKERGRVSVAVEIISKTSVARREALVSDRDRVVLGVLG